MNNQERICNETDFNFPEIPEQFPSWAFMEASEWQGLDEFDILVKAEEKSGKQVEIEYVQMSLGIWGLHVAKGNKAMIYLNSQLPLFWRRFALFHELYHLINHRKGEAFWMRTATPMSSFEHQADIFAWAAVWPEWRDGLE